MDTARHSNSGADSDGTDATGDTPEDLIARSMRKAVHGAQAPQPFDTSDFGRADIVRTDGLDDIAPVYRAEPVAAQQPVTHGPVDGDGRPSIVLVAIALMAVALMFIAYQCARGETDSATSDSASDTAQPDDAAPDETAQPDETGEATSATTGDTAGQSDAGTTSGDASGIAGQGDDSGEGAGDTTGDESSDDGAPDAATADDEPTVSPDRRQPESPGSVTTPPASPESIAAALDSGASVWRQSSAAAPGPATSPAAALRAGDATWIAADGALLRYDPAADAWTRAEDADLGDIDVVDADENDEVLRALVTEGDRAPAMITWNGADATFTWQPFELPDEAPVPDLLASTSDGELIVARSDIDQLGALLGRHDDAAEILRDGGIDLDERWIAGADIDGVTYIDPSVPVANWTEALLTRSEWSTFGIDSPPWLAYRPDSGDPLRSLQLVTIETVVSIPDPFGPDEYLFDLQGDGRGFEAITWNGSSVFGPTRWTSPDGRSWQRRGPANLVHRGHIPSVNGAHVRAGDHEYRIRSLGTEAVIEYRERGNEFWEIQPIADLVPGIGGGWTPRLVRVGPAGLIIIVDAVEASGGLPAVGPVTVALLSRDGTSFVAVDTELDVHEVVIADTYVLLFDSTGQVARLDPLG